jgi:hypothetical protein
MRANARALGAHVADHRANRRRSPAARPATPPSITRKTTPASACVSTPEVCSSGRRRSAGKKVFGWLTTRVQRESAVTVGSPSPGGIISSTARLVPQIPGENDPKTTDTVGECAPLTQRRRASDSPWTVHGETGAAARDEAVRGDPANRTVSLWPEHPVSHSPLGQECAGWGGCARRQAEPPSVTTLKP